MKNFLSVIVILSLIFGFPASLMAQPTPFNPENYFNSKYWVGQKDAVARINKFSHHKHVVGAYVKFDPNDLKTVVCKLDEIDSVVFHLAIRIDAKKDSLPTVLMVCYMKKHLVKDFDFNNIQYIAPQGYCPPPDGCTVQKLK